jgi:hypothetical protein
MHALARSLALAGGNKEIIRAIIIAKTEFTCTCDLFICLVDAVELSEE